MSDLSWIKERETRSERARAAVERQSKWEEKNAVRPYRIDRNTVLLLPPSKCNEKHVKAYMKRVEIEREDIW